MALSLRDSRPAHAGASPSCELNTSILAGVLEKYDEENKLSVLDLGAANNENLRFFARFRCTLHIADLQEELLAMSDLEDEEVAQQPLHLPQLKRAPDLVLLWDLPNYLTRATLQRLLQELQAHADQKTCCHTLLYTSRDIPQHPGRFQIQAANRITMRQDGTAPRGFATYSQEDLRKLAPGLLIDRVILMRNGTQELAFRFNST